MKTWFQVGQLQCWKISSKIIICQPKYHFIMSNMSYAIWNDILKLCNLEHGEKVALNAFQIALINVTSLSYNYDSRPGIVEDISEKYFTIFEFNVRHQKERKYFIFLTSFCLLKTSYSII